MIHSDPKDMRFDFCIGCGMDYIVFPTHERNMVLDTGCSCGSRKYKTIGCNEGIAWRSKKWPDRWLNLNIEKFRKINDHGGNMKSFWEVQLIDKNGDCWCIEHGIASNAAAAGVACMINNKAIGGLQVGLVKRIAAINFGLTKRNKKHDSR